MVRSLAAHCPAHEGRYGPDQAIAPLKQPSEARLRAPNSFTHMNFEIVLKEPHPSDKPPAGGEGAALASHPGLATELFRLFNEARSQYLPRLRSGAADDAGDRSLRKMARTVGGDPLPYGFGCSRKTLETFIRFNVEQSVIPQAVAPEDLFVQAPPTGRY